MPYQVVTQLKSGYVVVSATLVSEELELDSNEIPVPCNTKCVCYGIPGDQAQSTEDIERALKVPGYRVTDIHIRGDMDDYEPF
jgi:hypothetical protein